MDNQNHYHLGNRNQTALLIKEILPVLETYIVDAGKEFFTIRETMRILSISRTQLYYLRTKGLIQTKRVGRKVYITKTAIHDLVMNSNS